MKLFILMEFGVSKHRKKVEKTEKLDIKVVAVMCCFFRWLELLLHLYEIPTFFTSRGGVSPLKPERGSWMQIFYIFTFKLYVFMGLSNGINARKFHKLICNRRILKKYGASLGKWWIWNWTNEAKGLAKIQVFSWVKKRSAKLSMLLRKETLHLSIKCLRKQTDRQNTA